MTPFPQACRPGEVENRRQNLLTALENDLSDAGAVANKAFAAVVYGPTPYILVILVRGIEDQKQSAALMASISHVLWDEVTGLPAPRIPTP